MRLPSNPPLRLLRLLHFGKLDGGSKHHANDVQHERQIAVAHLVTGRVVLRIEALVGELFGHEHSLVAVVEEAGVIAAILHGVIVRVEDVQVQTVASRSLRESDHEAVRAVAVHVVMHVDTIAGTIAVRNHVQLDHADDGLISLLRHLVRIGVAAVKPLLFTSEVAETYGAARLHLQKRLGNLHQGDGAGSVIISARSLRFRRPRIAGGRVQVGAQVKHLLRVDAAAELDDQVCKRATAHLVGVAFDLEPEPGVELLEISLSQSQVVGVGVAAVEPNSLAVDLDVELTREFTQRLLDLALRNRSQEGSNLRVNFAIAQLDAGTLLVCGAADFLSVELAAEVFAVV